MNEKRASIIDVESTLNHPRNKALGPSFKSFLIECLGAIYYRKHKITTYSVSYEIIKDKPSFGIQLSNFSLINHVGVQEDRIVEFAAICINFVLMPIVFDYKDIRVTKREDGADYVLWGTKGNFVLESKGDTTKYKYKTRIEEGKKQLFTAFDRLKGMEIQFGIVGTSRFIIENNYIVRIEDQNIDNKKDSDLQNPTIAEESINKKKEELNKLTEKSSQIITDAMAFEAKGGYSEAKELYRKAFDLNVYVAMILEEIKSPEAISYWFSATNCALASDDFVRAMLILKDLENRLELSEEDIRYLNQSKMRVDSKIRVKETSIISKNFVRKIIKWIMFKTEETHEKIRGKGVIIKICLEFRQRLISYGYYVPISFNVNRNPIYSKEINQIIENYLKSGFLLQNDDKSLQLTSKARRMLLHEHEGIEHVFRNKFSQNFLDEIIQRIDYLGDKTSTEIMEIEKKEGITPYQYGRRIIHEMIR